MSLRKIKFVQREFYHLYNRGNSKQIIFKDKGDYKHFIGLLYACNQTENFKADYPVVKIFSYPDEGVTVGIRQTHPYPGQFDEYRRSRLHRDN